MPSCGLCKFGLASIALAAGAAGLFAAASPDEPATSPASPTSPQAPAPTPAPEQAPEAPKAPDPFVLRYTMKDITGKDVDLASFKGQVVMIVNTASRCGYTDQYREMQKLYTDKQSQGFVVLAFPANDFAGQEPGTDEQIKAFCEANYKVTFPLFSKISVKGANQHPLFKQIASMPEPLGGDPGWNFTKFIVDRNGNYVARFNTRMSPTDPEVLKVVDRLLAEKPAGS